MFGDVDKKLMKYFKRKQESPLDILIKLMKKKDSTEIQEVLNKERNETEKKSSKLRVLIYI